LRNGGANSLSAATTVLALDAYVTAVGPQAAGQQTVEALYKDSPNKPLTIDGLFGRADFDDKATKLKFSNQAEVPAFYMVEQAGFERTPPTKAITDGLEILREYTDKDDKAIKKIKLGDEVTVHVKFRAIGRSLTDAVLVDLMPGGFEPVIPSSEPAESAHMTGSADGADSSDSSADSSAEGEGDTEAAPQICECRFLYIHPTDFPEYADLREDRVVAYGTATDSIREFTYHIKATNIGKFTIPPAYGESMYDGKVKARSVAGTIEVVAP
jgi:uncharacterized protein YfaS (alpha-2-macroglobulin family)